MREIVIDKKGNFKFNLRNVNLSIPVFRVFSYKRLIQLFEEKKNILVKPWKWDDPFENAINKNNYFKVDGTSFQRPEQDCIFGQCWTLNNKETDALWRIYSPNKDGIRVKSTLGKLLYSLNNHSDPSSIGRIIYLKESQMETFFQTNIRTLFLYGFLSHYYKREAFSHENEVRIMKFVFDHKMADQSLFKYEIDPYGLIDEILFDPRMDDKVYIDAASELKAMGYQKKIFKSTLYSPPTFNITLHWKT